MALHFIQEKSIFQKLERALELSADTYELNTYVD